LINCQNIKSDRVIEAIPKNKEEDLLEIIRSRMQGNSSKSTPSKQQKDYSSELLESKEYTVPTNQPISISDEIRKLAKLK
jgi:hypothetical protein